MYGSTGEVGKVMVRVILYLGLVLLLGVILFAVPLIREQRMRAMIRRRPACTMHEWVLEFLPKLSGYEQIVEVVLRACGDVYGVQPGQLRPGDGLRIAQGGFRHFVLEDPYVALVDFVIRGLYEQLSLRWKPARKIGTVEDLLQDVIESARKGATQPL